MEDMFIRVACMCRCGWNCLSPDWLTPELAHNTVWSWAPNEPRSLKLSTAPVDPRAAAHLTSSLLDGERSLFGTQLSSVLSSDAIAAVQESQAVPQLFTPLRSRAARLQDDPPSEGSSQATLQNQRLQLEGEEPTHGVHSTDLDSLGQDLYTESHEQPDSFELLRIRDTQDAGEAVHSGSLETRADGGRSDWGTVPACAAMSAHDGRWFSVMCSSPLPASCRSILAFADDDPARASPGASGVSGGGEGLWEGAVSEGADATQQGDESAVGLPPRWVLGKEVRHSVVGGWTVATGASEAEQDTVNASERRLGGEASPGSLREDRDGGVGQLPYAGMQCGGCCPPGYAFTYPTSGWDSLHLWVALERSGKARAMLPIIPGVFR